MADKPDKFPDWALEEQADPVSGQLNRVEPPEFRKETGWQRREIPPRQWFNWQAWLTGRWIRWFEDRISDATTVFLRKSQNLSDVADAGAARGNLGLGSAATQNDNRYNHRSNNLSDVANSGTARNNLGLGSAATQADTRYNHRSNNLSDVADSSEARANLDISDLILQEVVASSTSDDSTTSTSFQNTSLSASITPLRPNSVIEVVAIVPRAQARRAISSLNERVGEFDLRNETDGVTVSPSFRFGRDLVATDDSRAASYASVIVMGRYTVNNLNQRTFRLRFRSGASEPTSVAIEVSTMGHISEVTMSLREIAQ